MKKIQEMQSDAEWLVKQPGTCMERIKPKVIRIRATPDGRTPEQKMADVKASDESTK